MRFGLPFLVLSLTACGSIGLDLDGDPALAEGAGASSSEEIPNGSGAAQSASGGAGASEGTGSATSSGGNLGSGGGFGTGGMGAGVETGGTTGSGGFDGFGGADPWGPEVLVYDTLNGPNLPGVPIDVEGTLSFTEAPTLDGSPVLKAIQGPHDTVVITHDFERVRGDDLYFRAWLYVPHGSVTGGLKLIGLHANENFGTDVNLLTEQRLEIFVHEGDVGEHSEPEAFPEDEWFCLRVHYRIGAEGFVDAFVGEHLEASVEGVDTGGMSVGVTSLDYGLPYANAEQKNGVVYWDNVVLATEPVSCE